MNIQFLTQIIPQMIIVDQQWSQDFKLRQSTLHLFNVTIKSLKNGNPAQVSRILSHFTSFNIQFLTQMIDDLFPNHISDDQSGPTMEPGFLATEPSSSLPQDPHPGFSNPGLAPGFKKRA